MYKNIGFAKLLSTCSSEAQPQYQQVFLELDLYTYVKQKSVHKCLNQKRNTHNNARVPAI